ncbi:MAG: ASCH domain-containing protein [Pseudobdellovibrionaceae bacterium]
MKAISIVSPNGSKIAKGEKTIEVRSWLPTIELGHDLLIVENNKFLRADGEIDPDGTPIAIVKIKKVREYLESDIPAACASRWEPGYFSWELEDVRPIQSRSKVIAARGIYDVDDQKLQSLNGCRR